MVNLDVSHPIKCLKCASPMKLTLTKKGIQIDICSSCHGVWLDKGELNFFVNRPEALHKYYQYGLENIRRIPGTKCPKCHSEMNQGRLPGLSYLVEQCSSCYGMYFDANEFKKIQSNKLFKKIQKDSFSFKRKTSDPNVYPFRLPSLALTTGIVFFSLYGLLFAVIVFFMEMMKLSVLSGTVVFLVFVCLQFYFSPIFLDWQLKFFGSLDWVSLDKLPFHFKSSLVRLCQENHIPFPKIGIIDDGSPQAYTYGRTPYSARIVLSKGMFQLLDQDELESVLAHELGHIKHWDFVLMTVIKIVPIILYNIYSTMKQKLEKQSSGKKKGGGSIVIAMAVSYAAYLIAECLVLFVSRVREYYADQFSCFASKKPNKLMTALIKISYGILNFKPSSEKEGSYAYKRQSIESFNIMNASYSKQVAFAGGEADSFNPESIKDIMRWDLWNPWAFFYEFRSTHPLTAKRINAIGSYAMALKQKPYILFNRKRPESYMDDFFLDLFFVFLPFIAGIFGAASYILINNYSWNKIMAEDSLLFSFCAIVVLCFSSGYLIKTMKAYPGRGKFFSCFISSLLKIVKVSPVSSFPVVLKGRVLGRGEAGFIFSEDFFIRDQTGMIFLNHEPFGFNFLFALLRFNKFQEKEVVVKGWYRRAPLPYIEVRSIQTSDAQSNSYTYHLKMAISIIGMILSILCILYFKSGMHLYAHV